MKNPLDYVTQQDIEELGLSAEDLLTAYQPSSGGVFHARGAEGKGKTVFVAHKFRFLVDSGLFTPADAVGNMTFKGKYADGYTTLKGDDLRAFLWDLTHKPLRHKIVIIDEADSEFPARLFTDKEQTEISLRLWHTAKLDNYIFLTSHIGNSTDIIMHLATHYFIYPEEPNFDTNTMDFTIFNKLDMTISDWQATDIIKTMLIYNRQELTENTEEEQNKARPKTKRIKTTVEEVDIDEEAELLGLA